MLRCSHVVHSLFLLLPVASVCAQQAAPDPFAPSRLARDGERFRMLLRQFRADEPGLGERHEAGYRDEVPEHAGARDLPAGHWVWVKPYWFVFRDGPDEEVSPRSWGSEQACGAPDTLAPGDHGSAWATREEDAAGEWLLLEYSPPVRAASLEVHETFNPGALASVAILDAAGGELEVWRAGAVARVADAGRVLRIDLPLGFTVERLKLTFRSDLVPGWNEIDAVGLHDDKGKLHWAARAAASTTFADAQGAAPRGVRWAAAVQGPAGAQGQVVFLKRIVGNEQPMRVEGLKLARRWVDVPEPLAPAVPLLVQPRVRVEGVLHEVTPLLGKVPDGADDAAALRAKVAELEAKVAALQAELERLRQPPK